MCYECFDVDVTNLFERLDGWQGQSEEEVSSLLQKMSSCGSLSCTLESGQMLFNVASGVGAFLRSTFVKGRPAEEKTGGKIRQGLRRSCFVLGQALARKYEIGEELGRGLTAAPVLRMLPSSAA